MDKIKEIISKPEFSKKLTVAINAFMMVMFVLAMLSKALLDKDLSVYTGQLLIVWMGNLAFYFPTKFGENLQKIKESSKYGNELNPKQ